MSIVKIVPLINDLIETYKMNDNRKTQEQLIQELEYLRRRIAELEKSETESKRVEEALRASEELFRSYLEYAPDGVYMSDLEGNFLYGNRKCEEIIGYRREELIGKNFLELNLLSENSLNKAAQLLQASIEGRATGPDEIELTSKEGRLIPVEINTSVFQRMGQGIVLAFVRDITDRKQAEELLQESEKRYRELTDFLPLSISTFEVDATGRIISFNRTAREVFGYNEEDYKEGMNALQFFAPEEWQRVKENMEKVIQGTSTPGQEFTFIRKDGRKFIGLIYASPTIHQNKTVGIRGVIIDITERKRTEEALRESEDRYRELSIVDDLTQLYNSRHFYHQLKMEIDRVDRYGQPLTLLLLDLDDFKTFNDTYGHVEGDRVLSRLGRVVKGCLRQTDSAYRYGGEEFTILLPMTVSADGAVTGERLRTEFKKEIFSPAPAQDVHLTLSIGLAQYKPQEDMKVFVHRVDQLMYQAKKNGKDSVCYEP